MGIGTLNEGSLHAAIKGELREPGDVEEVALDGFVIDIVRGDLLIEIQTAGFGALAKKFDHLLGAHRIHLVHPIATQTHIVRDGMATRRSPKRGTIYSLFDELVSLPTLLDHPNFSLEIFLVEQESIRVPDAKARRGRGGWRTVDRRLRRIVGRRRFDQPGDLVALVPKDLPAVWNSADLAEGAGINRRQAQAMAYCLRANRLAVEVGRDRAGIRHRLDLTR